MDLPGANQQRLLLSHFSITGLNLQYLIIYIQARHLHRQEPYMFVVLWLWMVASTLQLGLGCQRNLKAVKMHKIGLLYYALAFHLISVKFSTIFYFGNKLGIDRVEKVL